MNEELAILRDAARAAREAVEELARVIGELHLYDDEEPS